MRTLTRNERRALKLEIRKSKFSFDMLRVIVDCKLYDKRLYLLGMDIHDDKNGIAQRICIPMKTEPDMERIKEQLETLPAKVFYTPIIEAEKEGQDGRN